MKLKSDLIKRKYIDITEDFMNSIFDFFIEKK